MSSIILSVVSCGIYSQERNPVHLPIGEYLYKMKFDFDSKIKTLAARDCKMKKEQAQCRYVGPKSQRLLKRLKERGFKQIFDLLDDDKVFTRSFCSCSFSIFGNACLAVSGKRLNVPCRVCHTVLTLRLTLSYVLFRLGYHIFPVSSG